MSIGTALYDRTAALNTKMAWRDWSGYFAASAYFDSHEIEYNAIRRAAALIDVSPLFKYTVSGSDATALVDRIITRDATKIAPGAVIYTCWCDEDGKVVDDGTIARLDDDSYRWTAADPQLRWFEMNARGLDVEMEDVSEAIAAIALQGPLSRAVLEAVTSDSFEDLAYYRRKKSAAGDIDLDVSRTGYTGDLGYELWVDAEAATSLWDLLMERGAAFGIRPAGMLALDVARLEAGLILIEVDYTSSRHALIADHLYAPEEIGLGRLVNFKKSAYFVGRRALEAERDAGGAPRRLAGLLLDWDALEAAYATHDLPPAMSPVAWRESVPLFSTGVQVGRATSGTWSPVTKRSIALGSVPARLAEPGTRLAVEWTVEARRTTIPATVTPLPFFDPPRKKA